MIKRKEELDWFPISYKKKPAGKVMMHITWAHSSQANRESGGTEEEEHKEV